MRFLYVSALVTGQVAIKYLIVNGLDNKLVKINKNFAEIIGIILGDGHIHHKHNLITITGSLEDLKYYQSRVIKLFENEFKKTPILKRRNDRDSYYLMISSKEIVNRLIQLGMIRGSKKNASIPKKIFLHKKLALSFLRRLFDTDGCKKSVIIIQRFR